MRLIRHYVFLVLLVVLLAWPASSALAQQPPQPICFPGVPGIDHCIDSVFTAYWQRNGGLPVFGYPLGPLQQVEIEGRVLQVQWFERNRLELHPQNPPAYRVLLGRMGAERLQILGREAPAPSAATPQPGCRWFEATRQNVCDQAAGLGFKRYWETQGLRIPGLSAYEQSLALFGLPLTAAQFEPAANGELILTQWFERARFEWHPDNPDQFKVLLGLLGNELRADANFVARPFDPRGGRTPIGVEINRTWVTGVATRLNELRPDWVRYNGILWSEVEPVAGQRNWAALDRVLSEIALISASGAAPMVIVRGTPPWAQAVPGSACGPVAAQQLPAFASFMGELVTRLSGPPYNVKHWEFGNEPDVDTALVPGDSQFGCWGDANDAAGYGGARYATMLQAVYPAIKQADPQAQIIFGGLLLDCDPSFDASCQPGRFLAGVLAAGGGAYFDILSYHAYTFWSEQRSDFDLNLPKWAHRNGPLLGRLDFVRATMATYGVSKPVMMNEGGLLCLGANQPCGAQGLYDDQASYVVRMYARSWAADLVNSVWYTLNGPGWRDGGLLDRSRQPRPAFVAMRFLRERLDGATYLRPLSTGNLEGYAFATSTREYHIYWTNSATTASVALPPGFIAAYGPTGNQLTVGRELVVGFEPVIIEINR